MHEASLVTALLARVDAEARVHGLGRREIKARSVDVTLGELAGVEAELLLRAWEVLRIGTVCEDAELVLAREAARWECPRCGAAPPPDGYLRCPACAVPARLAAGGDLVLARLTLEMPDPESSGETKALCRHCEERSDEAISTLEIATGAGAPSR